MKNTGDISRLLSSVSLGLARLKGMNETAPLAGGRFTIQFDEWDWEVGVGLYGLLRYAELSGDEDLIASIAAWYDWQIERGLPPRQVNSTSPMLALSILIDHVDRPDWQALVQDWADWLVSGLAKTEDGGFQHVVKERMNDGELWDDTLFMTCLFLARAGKRFNRADWIDEAVHQFLVHTRYLGDPVSGLWYHGWTFNGRHNFAKAFWARGNSWITVAVPELIALVGDAMPPFAKRFLQSVLRSQVSALETLQRDDGIFFTLLDDSQSPVETSATAGFAYGILRAIDIGLLPEKYRPIADKAFQAVIARIGEDGIVLEVSDGTPMGHDLDFYRRIPNVPAPYGQALVMLLLVETLSGRKKMERLRSTRMAGAE
ncbi:glycoside hydrolase family 88/105 protein [Roseibium salinum]|uniref:Glycoside hydrolase family 88 protein n=1 Tax=Roseibium salinum TaxID=1604349 RepID=A0ABT3QXM6_9HYPH|nr:glycoside hydrolase family 88 protein [Roseibium sp. DSM 29163]MCX2721598.1 glycoside hydrolase family 88 protein [Roseibium sp. DSM 29163]